MFYAPMAQYAVKCRRYAKRWRKLAHNDPGGSDVQMKSIKAWSGFRREASRAQIRLTHPELFL
jgi:hypothetical protein